MKTPLQKTFFAEKMNQEKNWRENTFAENIFAEKKNQEKNWQLRRKQRMRKEIFENRVYILDGWQRNKIRRRDVSLERRQRKLKGWAIEAPAVIQELEETIIPKEDPWKGTTGFLGAWRLVIVTYPSYATRPSRCLEISLSFLK